MPTTPPAGNSPAPHRTFTAFCQDADGSGTIWIDTIEAPDVQSAIGIAEKACAACWGYNPDEVRCLGLAVGDIEIAFWDGESD